jgi:hypothetical protein
MQLRITQLGIRQRSSRLPDAPSASRPVPPKSQKFPEASVQETAPLRPPGTFDEPATFYAP